MHRLILPVILLTSSLLQAQDIKVGLKGGYDIVSIHRIAQVNMLRSVQPLEARNGYHAGFTVNVGLNNGFGFHFEPSFIRKGVIRGDEQKETMSYLEVPILFSVNPWKKLWIEAGPAAGFLLDANIELNGVVSPKPVTNEREISLVIGASWDVHDRINVGGRFARSLTTVWEIQFTNESGFITDEFEEYNQYLEFFLRVYLLDK